jgi:micrococcal nuclease
MKYYYTVLILLILTIIGSIFSVAFNPNLPSNTVKVKSFELIDLQSSIEGDGALADELIADNQLPLEQESTFVDNNLVPSSQGDVEQSDNEVPALPGMFRVTKVIDGDTIEVLTETGVRRVRYIGIDTPETVHPNRQVECFGREASSKNKELVEGKWVRLEKDINDTDRYGRWLRYVYVDDIFINYILVAGGYAKVFTYPPDVKYSSVFLQAEREARLKGLGLWGVVCEQWNFDTELGSVPLTSQQSPLINCDIKGNINNQGDRIYHLPRCQSYTQTLITPETGERWFCAESDAIAAGWRKAGNCP